MNNLNHFGPPLAFMADMGIIQKIAERALPMAIKANVDAPMGFWAAHIAVCHSVCPLDLEALYTAPDAEFAADVFGIRAYMHESGQWFTDWRPACRKSKTEKE